MNVRMYECMKRAQGVSSNVFSLKFSKISLPTTTQCLPLPSPRHHSLRLKHLAINLVGDHELRHLFAVPHFLTSPHLSVLRQVDAMPRVFTVPYFSTLPHLSALEKVEAVPSVFTVPHLSAMSCFF